MDTFGSEGTHYCLLESEAVQSGRAWEEPAESIFLQSEEKSNSLLRNVTSYIKTTRRRIPEDRNINIHLRENIKCHVICPKEILVF